MKSDHVTGIIHQRDKMMKWRLICRRGIITFACWRDETPTVQICVGQVDQLVETGSDTCMYFL